jgi:hypothetical protein
MSSLGSSWLLSVALLAVSGCDWPLCDSPCGDNRRCVDGRCVTLGGACVGGDCAAGDGSGGTDAGAALESDAQPWLHPYCPGDMVQILDQRVCIDRYEASRGPRDQALSQAGVIPWTRVIWVDARAACRRVAKRLCTADEWRAACAGPRTECLDQRERCYPFGPDYVPGVCNGPPEHAGEDPPEDLLPTGSLSGCVGGLHGLYDLAGNAREWLDSCNSFLCNAAGGSYQETIHSALACTGTFALEAQYENIREAAWSAYRAEDGKDIGFRCCLDLPGS